jgi:hypothetical protein
MANSTEVAMRLSRILLAAVMTVLLTTVAYAESWYLMAADEKVISDRKAANMMDKGAVVGPVRFTSTADFSSRDDCETSRVELVQEWRKQSIIARGGWTKHGFTTPNVFAQCVSASDPRLKSATGVRYMTILLQSRRRGY